MKPTRFHRVHTTSLRFFVIKFNKNVDVTICTISACFLIHSVFLILSEDERSKDVEEEPQGSARSMAPSEPIAEKIPEILNEQEVIKDNVLKVLGIDPTCTYKEIKYHPELSNTWSKWMVEGLPEKNKKEILESYNRRSDFYSEAPKLNLEIVPLLTDIAKKRDQHFTETQNCVGTAISALGAAVSMLIEPSEEGVDEDMLTDYISHAGQILTDIFHQQSVARKSFITPQLSKNIKPVVESILSKEWLYGDNLKDKVKDIKEIDKACAEMKEKAPLKPTAKARDQGNGRYPPAIYRQVGQQQRRRQIKFKTRPYTSAHRPSKPASRMTNPSSSRK